MVGHTGVIPAAVKAVETVDECLGRVVEAVHAGGGACIVTADHGNADHMLEPDGSPNTAHSLNPVPLVVTADAGPLSDGGILADVAPTVLALLGMQQPGGDDWGLVVEGDLSELLRGPQGSGSSAIQGAHRRAGRRPAPTGSGHPRSRRR